MDKVLHFIVGAAVALVVMWGADDALLAMALVTALAALKEVFDAAMGGEVDVLDAAATVAGGLLIVGIA